MKMVVRGKLPDTHHNIMRKIGYGQVVDPRAREISYQRRLASGRYPRFHVYLGGTSNEMVIKIHIDQKKASYKGHTAHSGEYEGPLVEEELKRIQQAITQLV